MTDKSPLANPYEAPAQSVRQSIELPDSETPPTENLSSDSAANLSLTSKLMKIATVVFVLASLVPIIQLIAGFTLIGFPKGWTWWHTTVAYRTVYCPCWLLLAWMLWKYACSLDGMTRDGMCRFEHSTKRQAKVWLAVGLLLLVAFAGVAVSAVFLLLRGPRP